MKTLLATAGLRGAQSIRQVPDSALLLGGRPLFLEEDEQQAHMLLMPAVRISRLGLAIGERFAARYFDAATVVALRTRGGRIQPDETDLIADAALAVDIWQPLPDNGMWEVGMPDGSRIEWNTAGVFERMLSEISARTTFKTGDILVAASLHTEATLAPGGKSEILLNGTPTLRLKIR